MNHIVNIALQVIPRSSQHGTYELVDKAIEVIKKSGIKFKVCPFETVMEGKYDEIMQVIKNIHEVLYANGTEGMLTYIKIQTANKDVTISDKMEKYE